jgi:hypothetical protein
MNAVQTAYATAKAQLETLLANAKATYPAMPAETADEDTWMAYFEATEDCDQAAGVYAARNVLFAAENALLAWGKTTKSAKKSGLNFDMAARSGFRDRLLDICFRANSSEV